MTLRRSSISASTALPWSGRFSHRAPPTVRQRLRPRGGSLARGLPDRRDRRPRPASPLSGDGMAGGAGRPHAVCVEHPPPPLIEFRADGLPPLSNRLRARCRGLDPSSATRRPACRSFSARIAALCAPAQEPGVYFRRKTSAGRAYLAWRSPAGAPDRRHVGSRRSAAEFLDLGPAASLLPQPLEYQRRPDAAVGDLHGAVVGDSREHQRLAGDARARPQ
jgi:hypothetical protein